MAPEAPKNHVRVAVSQYEPAWLDLEASVTKTCTIIEEAAKEGAKLIAFPECWIPGYPAWIWTRAIDFDTSVRYVQNSLVVDSPEMRRICAAAAEHDVNVALGFSERSGESVYIAQALISSKGELKMTRRKMKPTHLERTVFGDASGHCLAEVVKVPEVGSVGALSCWEHIQPLLKYYTFSQNEQIHVAAWPPLDSFIEGSPGFWSMTAEGCLNLSQTYAVEAQAFVLHATSALGDSGIEVMGTKGSPIMGNHIQGSSAIVGPDGRIVASGEGQEMNTLIVADSDLNLVTKAKTFADASGHYSRPDLLWLGADPELKPVVRLAKPGTKDV